MLAVSMNGETLFHTPQITPFAGYANRLSRRISQAFLQAFAVVLLGSSVWGSQLTLTWNDNSDNEDGFKIERSTDGETFEEIGTVGSDVSTYLDTTIVDNQEYVYRVKAFNQYGDSGYSNTANGLVENSNQAPSISGLTDVSILEGGDSGTMYFTVGDAETNALDLVVTGVSSNPSLLENGGILLGGAGAERTLDLNPVGGASGTSIVTLQVSDGTNTTDASFLLTVHAITAPTITPISSFEVGLGESVSPLAFTIADEATAAEDLTVSVATSNGELIPEGNLNLSGQGAERTLAIAPVEGKLGVAEITVTVGNGIAEAIESFEIAVKSAPIIVKQPLGIEETIGGPTGFSLEVKAYPEASYQWLFNGEPIDGATQSEYLIDIVTRESEGQYSVIVANDMGNTVSEEAYLTVVSQIQVVQAPIDITVEGENTAVLSVNAEGPNLQYQWYRGESGDRSNPIEGATSSTYTTDTLSTTAKYWVEVTVGGINQGNDFYASDTTTVFFQQVDRYYFGSFGDNGEGTFALVARADDTAVFLGKIDSLGLILEASDIPISANGSFVYEEDGTTVLAGTIDGDLVSGSVAGSQMTFSGALANNDGPTADYAGFYFAVLPNTADGQVLAVVGPDGQSYVSVGLGASSEAGQATIDSAGTLTADLSEEYAMALALNDEYASLAGTVLIGEADYSVDGQREDVETKKILFNTSIRGQVKSGSSTMIAGFVVGGAGAKKVLIRGIGPSLTERGVANAVADPRITLYRLGESDPIGSNDNWGQAANASEISIAAQQVGATPLGSSTADAAMLLELTQGVYTAHINSSGGSEGTALVEVFDVSEAEGADTDAQLANISMRGEVSTGDDVIIAGFVVSGDSPKRLLVRAIGPELAGYGVSAFLADPKLTIYQATNEGSVIVATNDDWHEEAEVASSAAAQSGAFAFDEGSNSAAKVIWLDPGLYTAVAESDGPGSGVALVEVYEVE